jgi:tetratricopeptide (TPR) repeat protein
MVCSSSPVCWESQTELTILRYLFEISSYKSCTEFANTAIQACGHDETLLLAHLSQTVGYAERERGYPKEAEIHLDRAKCIREKLLPPNHPEIANIYSSLAGVYVSTGRYDEGLQLFQEAVNIDLATPYTEHKWIIFRRYLNMATAERLKGNPTSALDYVELATPYILDSFGADSHFDTTYVFILIPALKKRLT